VRNTDVAKVDMDIAYVAMAIHLCCKYLFKMFLISLVCCKCFLSGCCICCSSYIHILQAYVTNAPSALVKSAFHVASVSWAGAHI
jgi:hypothetical protein